MNKRLLFVDDEANVLSGIKRILHKSFEVTTALGPELGIACLKKHQDFAVVIADMQMPGMNGIEFLKQAQQIAPDSVRIMLTGNADQQTVVAAVNDGEVFRFLNKPCEAETLSKVMTLGVRQYQLITAEKEILNRTLKGSISALSDILSIAKPAAFGRVKRLRNKCKQVAEELSNVMSWELDAAALLSQLGCVNISPEILEKVAHGESLLREEFNEYIHHPEKGAELIEKIPRLENVSKIVAYQYKSYDGSGRPFNDCKGEQIPIEARILNVVLAYDERKNAGWSDSAVLDHLKRQENKFDPQVLKALEKCADPSEHKTVRIEVEGLRDDMLIEEDVLNENAVLLVCRGSIVNSVIREHLLSFKKNDMLKKQILVQVVS